MSVETAVEEHREQIATRLGEPDRLQFPSGWTMSSSWQRAQAAPSTVGPVNPAEFDVLLGYVDDRDKITHHRVLFALYEGQLRAECECDGYSFRGWCAHVALLWWKWSRDNLAVTDLDASRVHTSPPWWLSVDDVERDRVDAEPDQPVETDGGAER